MKIEGPGRTQKAGQTMKKDKVSGDGSFGDFLTGDAGEAAPASASQAIARIDVLLAAQGAEDPAQKAARQRMQRRAHHLLAELDLIRLGLLSGTLTVGHVIDIADVVASHRERIVDPELTLLLDEIDLRAQIELAKMRAALDRKALS